MSFGMIIAAAAVLFPQLCYSQQRISPALQPLPDEGMGYEHVERLINVLEQVRLNHPDGEKLSYDRLINHALEGMLNSLDEFSGFYHPETYSFISDKKREPSLPGLGITLGKSEDRIKVTAVHSGSAADEADILPGDYIIAINGQPVTKLTLSAILKKLQGPAGERVVLTLSRTSSPETHEAPILRRVVRESPVPAARLLKDRLAGDQKTGYLHLSGFTATSHRDVEVALDDLEDRGMEALLLDLRGNPGGLLTAAVSILGEFLPPSTEVVFTRGRNPEHNSPPMKTPAIKRRNRSYPVAVLLDRNSASASELVAGALQDLERAIIIGETSFGKGSFQRIMPMDDTALRLTIATYHTPSGRSPQGAGILPDIEVDTSDEDQKNLARQRRCDSLSPDERQLLESWENPVIVGALKAISGKYLPN